LATSLIASIEEPPRRRKFALLLIWAWSIPKTYDQALRSTSSVSLTASDMFPADALL
jgi:hypothetical protein